VMRRADARLSASIINSSFHQVHVHRLAGGLHHEHIGPADVFLDLHIRFAVLEARDQGLSAR